MQVSVEQLEGLMRQVTVTLSADLVDSRYQKKLKQVTASAKIAGFRPGKVPPQIIERQFGLGVRQEVLSEIMDESFRHALEQESIKIAGMPQVSPLKEYKKGEPFEYSVKFEIYPEIELRPLEGECVERLMSQLVDDDYTKMLDKLREQHAQWLPSEHPAERGDKVIIDFEGFIEGKAFEGGIAQDYELELGTETMIPGFEDGLLAASFNDETVLHLSFPENYHAKELAGKPVEFKIKIKKVLRSEPVESDEVLAEKIGFKGGKEELLIQLKKTMQSELNKAVQSDLKEKILNKLLEKHDILVPQALVEEEIKHLQKVAVQQLMGGRDLQGLDLGKLQLPTEPYQEEAIKRVKLGLLLSEIIKQLEIKSDADKVRSRIEEIVAGYPDPGQVMEVYYHNKELLSEVEASVLEDTVVERLTEKMVVNEKQVSYDELMNPKQPEEQQQ